MKSKSFAGQRDAAHANPRRQDSKPKVRCQDEENRTGIMTISHGIIRKLGRRRNCTVRIGHYKDAWTHSFASDEHIRSLTY